MASNIRENEEESIVAEINITPLTDIFLVLLIIFMISSSAMLEGGLQVKLPTAKNSALTKSDSGKPVYLTISKDGQLTVNERTADDNSLGNVLQDVLKTTGEKTVIIRGDEGVVLGRAVRIMDAARAAGAEKIALATQPPK
jgi:biopolymer transport protein ExbD